MRPARTLRALGNWSMLYAFAGLDRKILKKTQFCDVYQKYGTGTRCGRWQGRRLAEWAGRAGARMGRAIGMCNRVAHLKNATTEETLTLIESPREDNLPVQPVAQCLGIKTLTNPLATACGGAQNVSTRAVMSGQRMPDLWRAAPPDSARDQPAPEEVLRVYRESLSGWDSKIRSSEGVSMKLEHSTLVSSNGKKIITGTWRTGSGQVTSQTVKSIDLKSGKTAVTNVSGGKLLP